MGSINMLKVCILSCIMMLMQSSFAQQGKGKNKNYKNEEHKELNGRYDKMNRDHDDDDDHDDYKELNERKDKMNRDHDDHDDHDKYKEKRDKELKKAYKYKDHDEKGNNGRGNAYGKNKGGLTGREFGKQRAEDARKKINDQLFEIQIEEKKLRSLRERLESSRSQKDISRERLQKIQEAERSINEAEARAKRAKEILTDKAEKIKEILEID